MTESSTNTPDRTPAQVAPSEPSNGFSRFAEWMLRHKALEDVRSRAKLPPDRAAAVARGREAVALADAMLDASHPAHGLSQPWLAVSLCREAAYFALVANGVAGETLAEAFDKADRSLTAAATDDAGLSAVRAALVERSSAETSARPRVAQRSDAILCKAFVESLLDHADERRCTEERLLLERRQRVFAAALMIAIAVAGAMIAGARQRPAPRHAESVVPATTGATPPRRADVSHDE